MLRRNDTFYTSITFFRSVKDIINSQGVKNCIKGLLCVLLVFSPIV
jgi:hypothetical protein